MARRRSKWLNSWAERLDRRRGWDKVWRPIGLLALSWIFVGSWRGFHRHCGWRNGMHERWAQMTPEQREEFRKAMQSRWQGRCGPGRKDSVPADASPADPTDKV